MTSKCNLEASANSIEPPEYIICHLEPCQSLINELAYFIASQSTSLTAPETYDSEEWDE